jgi:hypothetical protein
VGCVGLVPRPGRPPRRPALLAGVSCRQRLRACVRGVERGPGLGEGALEPRAFAVGLGPGGFERVEALHACALQERPEPRARGAERRLGLGGHRAQPRLHRVESLGAEEVLEQPLLIGGGGEQQGTKLPLRQDDDARKLLPP